MEILTDSDPQNVAKEILTSVQLILCHSENLPLHIIADLFDSILIIINSTDKIVIGLEGKLKTYFPTFL